MKELSIFIDESGDFGEYDYHSPWYIVTMVFHEQEASIQEPMEYLNRELSLLGLENHCIHTGPIIRKSILKILLKQRVNFQSKYLFLLGSTMTSCFRSTWLKYTMIMDK